MILPAQGPLAEDESRLHGWGKEPSILVMVHALGMFGEGSLLGHVPKDLACTQAFPTV